MIAGQDRSGFAALSGKGPSDPEACGFHNLTTTLVRICAKRHLTR